jgi:L-alanine-DL-glutamate epimerase-like enolase superfamily enzyme
MKVGRRPEDDVDRVRAARKAIGDGARLYVDANGGYGAKQAIAMAELFAGEGVVWFEEPVSSDDLEGLRLVRDHVPPPMEVAAGEYGFDGWYFRRMLDAGAVDVLQADATRCGGITGLSVVASLCETYGVPLSAHTAPALHMHPCCALASVRNVEYFHDHVRIEKLLFDGVVRPVDGRLAPDRTRPGLGLELKRADAQRYMIHG